MFRKSIPDDLEDIHTCGRSSRDCCVCKGSLRTTTTERFNCCIGLTCNAGSRCIKQ
jgi:hypothetical protein